MENLAEIGVRYYNYRANEIHDIIEITLDSNTDIVKAMRKLNRYYKQGHGDNGTLRKSVVQYDNNTVISEIFLP